MNYELSLPKILNCLRMFNDPVIAGLICNPMKNQGTPRQALDDTHNS